ncbi:hypothetical protein FF38_12380 [Lucilia cuprina]|uniref:PHD-type domain-containing protein n=1 Tax=Lucilia cuprina TaxID=7375 RepID=A0A0L0BYB0_LUCCU|nr:hypothetical protein FF38_12380 [Lucilia cuprina]
MSSICGVCNIDVGTGRKRSLLCRTCNTWFHVDCEGVSKDVFSTLDKNRNLLYTCKECTENPPDPDNDNLFKEEIRKEFAAFKKLLRLHEIDMKKDQAEINMKLETVVSEIRKEISTRMDEIKDEVKDCKQLVNLNDKMMRKKFNELELQNHVFQSRLNRSDIIITGLSNDLQNLTETVKSLCSYLKVDIMPDDILNVVYIRKRNAVLVKFGRISTRDKIMSQYFQEKSLNRSHVEGGNICTRVYLNDNYSSLAQKFLRICWKLAKDNRITHYSIINRELLKAKLTMPNGDIRTMTFNECIEFFKVEI